LLLREGKLKADEIFVLLLIVVCLCIVVASAIHSRTARPATEAPHPQVDEDTMTAPAGADDGRAERPHRAKKRRRKVASGIAP
jgi:hypothetical protein